MRKLVVRVIAALLLGAGLIGCGGDADHPEPAGGTIVVAPENPDVNSSITITFPTPYHLGEITPQAEEWEALLNDRRERQGRSTLPPAEVGGGDNYHVVLEGPWGPDCEDRSEFALGHFPERGADTLTVSIDRLGRRNDGPRSGAAWCPGHHSGHVEFRLPSINPKRVPFERLGTFSFTVAEDPSAREANRGLRCAPERTLRPAGASAGEFRRFGREGTSMPRARSDRAQRGCGP